MIFTEKKVRSQWQPAERWNMQLNGGQFSTRNHKFHSSTRVYWIGINSAATQPKGSFLCFCGTRSRPIATSDRGKHLVDRQQRKNYKNHDKGAIQNRRRPTLCILHSLMISAVTTEPVAASWARRNHTNLAFFLRSDNCLHPSASFWWMEWEPLDAVFSFFTVLILPPDYLDKKSRPSVA